MQTLLEKSLADLAPDNHLKALNGFIALTQNPANFDAIYDLDEVLRQTNLSAISIAYLKTLPGIAAIIEERYLAPTPDLSALLTCPPDSLGYQYADHLIRHQFDPNFYRPRAVTDDISYVSLRRSQTHDIHHVVTGFSTDPSGELGLQAFQLAQMKSPIAIAIITTGIVNALASSPLLETHMEQILRGWQMGLTAHPLLAQKWEDHWEKSLAQWRLDLNLQALN